MTAPTVPSRGGRSGAVALPAALPPAPAPAGAVPRADLAEFLPDILAVTERRHSPLASLLVVLVAAFFGLALLWAYFAEVDQVASALGVVRPTGRTKTINHPEGGRVVELLVAEGSVVAAGQPLIRLDPELESENARRQVMEWQSLAAEVARLEAEASGGDIVFPDDLAADRPDLVATQRRLFAAHRESFDSRRASADKVIEQRRNEAAALTQTMRRLEGSLAVLKEKEQAVASLVEKGFYPRLRHLEIQGEIAEHEGRIAEIKEQRFAARSALAEAESQRLGLDRTRRAEVLDQLEARRRERDTLASNLQQTRARRRNLEIRAPVAGVVQNLVITSPGQSIGANEALMNLVPSGDSLVVEARVSNDDIGYVSVGQRATVKVRTYDFLRYGTLDGVVEQVAADATKDPESGEFSFNVFVRTEHNRLGDGGAGLAVQPGMLVDVDLQIGKRSILSYMTDRILRTTESAFRER